MNPKDMFVDLPADEREELAHLVGISEGLQPRDQFLKRTEMQLKDAFAAKKEKTMKRFNLLWQVFAGTAAVAVLTLGTIWLVRIALPKPRNPAMPVNSSFVCPVSKPNGSLPPGETNNSPFYLGNGQLWTSLWPEGKVIMNERDNREPDGSLSIKWGWVRGIDGPLTIEGRRLDGPAEPLRADITSGYGDAGLQITVLNFPTTGCWEVTGRVGDASLTFVTEVVMEESPFPTLTPAAIPQPSATPAAPTYDWNDTTVYRMVDFPQAPAEMSLYTYSPSAPITLETARKLAERLGINGEVYLAPNSVAGPNGFMITDGEQHIYVNSDTRFSYESSYHVPFQGAPLSVDAVFGSADSFLKSHGYDFAYKLKSFANGVSDWFRVEQLMPDGRSIYAGIDQPVGAQIQFDQQGKALSFIASMLDINPQPKGQYGIISAEDAWQKVLQNAPLGALLSSSSALGEGRLLWMRAYPDGQPMTLSGTVEHFAPAEAGKPPFVTIAGYALTGETAGLEKLEPNALATAQGQFIHENGVQKFEVDSWQIPEPGAIFYAIGDMRREDGKVLFSADGKDYTLSEAPDSIPLPVKNIDVNGILNGDQLEWQSILYFKDGIRGGGGGGGGSEMAQLNLSGTPVPWPPLSPMPTPTSLAGLRIDGQRGIVSINIYQKIDGSSQRAEYYFATSDNYYLLRGEGLEQLQAYNNRPVVIWGKVGEYSSNQSPILDVERFEVPFPDLKFQVLRGTQKNASVGGEPVTLFTSEDGKSYVQLMTNGQPDPNVVGLNGTPIQVEAIIIPDETFGDYPAIRIFGWGPVKNLKTGKPETLELRADKPNILPESMDRGVPPTLKIETIELVYYTADPRYAASSSDAMATYIQPVWHFYGHYSDGSQLEILVQALKQEFLLPEAVPMSEGG